MDTKDKAANASATLETVAGMTDKRFMQWSRIEALKIAQDAGRAHLKLPPLIVQDAELLHDYIMTGALPKK